MNIQKLVKRINHMFFIHMFIHMLYISYICYTYVLYLVRQIILNDFRHGTLKMEQHAQMQKVTFKIDLA